jgi:hypothetical protein
VITGIQGQKLLKGEKLRGITSFVSSLSAARQSSPPRGTYNAVLWQQMLRNGQRLERKDITMHLKTQPPY